MGKILLRAFSLVELMVTLIVVSILTAAMAPVITKRLKSKEITVSQGGGKGLSMNCQSISPSCGLCEGNVCVSCAKSCTENEALDIPNCACKSCNSDDFHGSACLKCDMENCSKCSEGYYLTSGSCMECTDGYTCNGTNQNPCPKGYYCKDGITTPCSAGTYNDTQGATSESACVDCSVKTANCTNCDIATGVCNTCSGGMELQNGECKSKDFTYSYTGSATKTTMTDYIRIVLKSSGTFTANSSADGTVFVLGGGGGGGGTTFASTAAKAGCMGYSDQSDFSFVSGASWTVTIGAGGSGAGQACYWPSTGNNGSNGGSTSFEGISAAGGGGGKGLNQSGSCAGGSSVTFADMSFPGSGGVNTGAGGSPGSGVCGGGWDGGEYQCGCGGTSGYSGVVVIKIPN